MIFWVYLIYFELFHFILMYIPNRPNGMLNYVDVFWVLNPVLMKTYSHIPTICKDRLRKHGWFPLKLYLVTWPYSPNESPTHFCGPCIWGSTKNFPHRSPRPFTGLYLNMTPGPNSQQLLGVMAKMFQCLLHHITLLWVSIKTHGKQTMLGLLGQSSLSSYCLHICGRCCMLLVFLPMSTPD